ncbi:hypothetical protein CSUB01_09135 [Colletotrichum sublineola]|uniref:Uncharacterized protein n=1 Tax=Colletotrichum sublineola TaxID=1173701 RepID=A0A066XJN1_COLSU|nr:hypothetical protein CSUB01_09135 [Colletotrichum sublineola]
MDGTAPLFPPARKAAADLLCPPRAGREERGGRAVETCQSYERAASGRREPSPARSPVPGMMDEIRGGVSQQPGLKCIPAGGEFPEGYAFRPVGDGRAVLGPQPSEPSACKDRRSSTVHRPPSTVRYWQWEMRANAC